MQFYGYIFVFGSVYFEIFITLARDFFRKKKAIDSQN